MKKAYYALTIAGLLMLAGTVSAEQGKGLNVLVSSADRQTQMMAMVLSVQAMQKHGKELHMVLCGAAGDLALQSTETQSLLPSNKSPTMLLKTLLQLGASVQVCPLYLPNAGKTADDLIPGITVAEPAAVAGRLLDKDYQSAAF